MFWVQLKSHFSLSHKARVKNDSDEGLKHIFITKYRKSIAIIITLDGIEKIKTEKMMTKQSEQSCNPTNT